MPSISLVFPLPPGGFDRLKELSAAVQGPRRAEHLDFLNRMRVQTENWYVQHTPRGDVGIVYLEGEDLPGTMQALLASDHPYDVWFKDQMGSVHGLEFADLLRRGEGILQLPQEPAPEPVFQSAKL